ncbi:MAG TPA: nucleoside 2-deoxyribosyltransferase domain-containing protein, partial [Streptomyces sp.]
MIDVVQAREPLTAAIRRGPSVFLAGPTAEAGSPVASWRPPAIRLLAQGWANRAALTVLTPENPVRADRYGDQFTWENDARAIATMRLYWIFRDMQHLPGMTTNIELGFDLAAGRALVLGCPLDCPDPRRNRYAIALARACGRPVRTTLPSTVATAIEYV